VIAWQVSATSSAYVFAQIIVTLTNLFGYEPASWFTYVIIVVSSSLASLAAW